MPIFLAIGTIFNFFVLETGHFKDKGRVSTISVLETGHFKDKYYL